MVHLDRKNFYVLSVFLICLLPAVQSANGDAVDLDLRGWAKFPPNDSQEKAKEWFRKNLKGGLATLELKEKHGMKGVFSFFAPPKNQKLNTLDYLSVGCTFTAPLSTASDAKIFFITTKKVEGRALSLKKLGLTGEDTVGDFLDKIEEEGLDNLINWQASKWKTPPPRKNGEEGVPYLILVFQDAFLTRNLVADLVKAVCSIMVVAAIPVVDHYFFGTKRGRVPSKRRPIRGKIWAGPIEGLIGPFTSVLVSQG